MTPYNKLSKQKRQIIDIIRAHGGVVNSFVLEIDHRLLHASSRILEMRRYDGWPFLPKEKLKHYSNGSVDYALGEVPEQKYEFIGNRAIPVENLKPIQQQMI